MIVVATVAESMARTFLMPSEGINLYLDGGTILAFVITICLCTLFKYGVKLQQESDETLYTEVGDLGKIVLRLDRVMADRKMSLNELSEKVGVANVNLSKMKNGRISAIRFSTLAAICQVLQCQPGDILEYEPDEE